MTRPLPKRVGLDWFELACGHHITIGPSVAVPAIGDDYWCRQHCDMSIVSRRLLRSQQFISHCEADSCRFSRNYGVAKLTAELAATKHAQKHPGHRVVVIDGNGKVIQASEHQEVPDTLDF